MTKHRNTTKKPEGSSVDTNIPRIVSCGGGTFARILTPTKSRLVKVDTDEYFEALDELSTAVGRHNVNIWLRGLGWPELKT